MRQSYIPLEEKHSNSDWSEGKTELSEEEVKEKSRGEYVLMEGGIFNQLKVCTSWWQSGSELKECRWVLKEFRMSTHSAGFKSREERHFSPSSPTFSLLLLLLIVQVSPFCFLNSYNNWSLFALREKPRVHNLRLDTRQTSGSIPTMYLRVSGYLDKQNWRLGSRIL